MQAAAPERLSQATLPGLAGGVTLPGYDRATVTPGIVHLGIGAFHRAHQAVYIDDCLASGVTDWGIVAASLRRGDTRDALRPQDGLYALAVRDTAGESVRVIGAVQDVIVAPESPERLLAVLGDPRIRIVTLTVTEKGYAVDLANGTLKADDTDIRHDLAHPGEPRSALGFLTEAIARRRARGVAPFTVLSCDNLPRNGRTLHGVLTRFATLRDPELGAFVAEHVACPSCMVDRIVPATTEADRAAIGARLGLHDAWPVVGEPFAQWVIEDRFPAGRPRLEAVGVEFVDDVEPFEHMKLRLLNGSHTAIAAIGRLAGIATVADAVRHPVIRAFVERYWAQVVPTLAIEPDRAFAYTRQLLARFENRAIQHRTAQIASDASQKLPQRILAPLRDLLAQPAPLDAPVFAVAAWIRSCGGASDAGDALPLNDPVFQAWTGAPDQRSMPPAEILNAFLRLATVFGSDLPAEPRFVVPLSEALDGIVRHGVIEALARGPGNDGALTAV